jgi:hypothetical protein
MTIGADNHKFTQQCQTLHSSFDSAAAVGGINAHSCRLAL